MAQDVVDTLDAFGLDETDLIGHSMGGRVACEVARLARSRVKSVVLVDPPLSTREEFLNLQLDPANSGFPVFETVDDLVAGPAHGMSDDARAFLRREIIAALEETPGGGLRFRLDQEVSDAIIADFADHLPVSMGGFHGRVLLLVGTQFEAVTEQGVAGLRSQLGGRLEVVELDAGHVLLWEAFEETVGAIQRFYASGVDAPPAQREGLPDGPAGW